MQDSLGQLLTLYRDSFPQNERRSEPDLIKALASPAYRVVMKEELGQLLGFAILFIPPAADFALLEYLAVHADRRGEGAGRELVASAINAAAGRHLLTEVESASPDPASLRRQQFYQRCGFAPIAGLAYQLPLPGNPPPMEIWLHRPTPGAILRTTLFEWIKTIYTDVYACSPTDPRIAQMVAPLPPLL